MGWPGGADHGRSEPFKRLVIHVCPVLTGQKVLDEIQKTNNITVSMQEMTISVVVTVVLGAAMLGAGLVAMMFNGIKGKEKLPFIMGVILLVCILASNIINIVMLRSSFSLSFILWVVIHGLYLYGAYRNKQNIEAENQ